MPEFFFVDYSAQRKWRNICSFSLTNSPKSSANHFSPYFQPCRTPVRLIFIWFLSKQLHKNVIRDIENIKTQFRGLTQRAEFSAVKFPPTEKYFIDSTYKAGTGKNYKSYEVTRDGFMLLSMGFTGEKALALKIAYILQL